jgi:hypothetical protein
MTVGSAITNNIALVELLQLRLLRIEEKDDLKRYQGSVFIDTQGTTSGLTERLRKACVPTLVIVDHHEPQGMISAQFTDIRNRCERDCDNLYRIYRKRIAAIGSRRRRPRASGDSLDAWDQERNWRARAGRSEDFIAAAYLAEFVDQETLAAVLSNSGHGMRWT